jgi:hypothetical protein
MSEVLRSAGAGIDRALAWLGERPRASFWLIALFAFIVLSDQIGDSPDSIYDEAVYTRAAQNLANHGELTWQTEPVFVHPPMYFVTQAAWLKLTGTADAGLFDAIPTARSLSAAFTALSIALMGLFVLRLTSIRTPRRRALLMLAVALLGTFDAVLLRYGRLVMIEPLSLFMSLTTIYFAWQWRSRPAVEWIVKIGLLSGVALLVKEISIFLLAVPLLFGVLTWSAARVARALGALAVALAMWLSFPAWALALGLWDRFAEEKLNTIERLLGIIQATGFNRPNASFSQAFLDSAPQYISSYLLLETGLIALVWLWLGGKGDTAMWLVAWLAAGFAFGAYTVTRGQLNEQFFTYLMPGAIIGTVVLADASRCRIVARAGPWRRALPPALIAVPLALVLGPLVLGGVNFVRLYHTGRDHGIAQLSDFVGRLPACSALNASGDVQKYAFSIGGNRITNFASGSRATTRGVHYFFLNPKDAVRRYGRMTPDLARWIRSSGTRIAAYESHTYESAELWYVASSPFDPVADIQPLRDGAFVNVFGSACGGYAVVNKPGRHFFTAYQGLGGKPVLGRPQSGVWEDGRRVFQAFDTVIMGGSVGAATPPRPEPITRRLVRTAPDLLATANLPRPRGQPPTTRRRALALLTDPSIAEAYLGRGRGSAGQRLDRARARWGAPLGPPQLMKDGVIRQPFETMVLERRPNLAPSGRALGGVKTTSSVSLALIGSVAADAGLIPGTARRPRPVPKLLPPQDPRLPSRIGPFLLFFAASLSFVAAAGAVGTAAGRRQVARLLSPVTTRVAAAREGPARDTAPFHRNRVLITRSVLEAPTDLTPAIYQYVALDRDRPVGCTRILVAGPHEDPSIRFLELAVLPMYARAMIDLHEVVTFPAAAAMTPFSRRCGALGLIHLTSSPMPLEYRRLRRFKDGRIDRRGDGRDVPTTAPAEHDLAAWLEELNVRVGRRADAHLPPEIEHRRR